MVAPFIWRIRLEMAADTRIQVEIDLGSSIILGIGPDSADTFDLSMYGAASLGVSRMHARLEPTPSAIHVTDLGSTNGTTINGERLRQDVPMVVRHGDHVMLGDLAFIIQVIDTPGAVLDNLRQMAELSEILIQMAKTIPAQPGIEEILDEALQFAMGVTPTGTISVWLVEEDSDKLILAARRSLHAEDVPPLDFVQDPDLLRALTAREPFSDWHDPDANGRQGGSDSDHVLYVPMMHGNQGVGVICSVHQKRGLFFSPRDVKALSFMADLCAVAIQNVRQYKALQEQDRQKAELMQNIGHEFRSPLQYIVGFASLILDEQKKANQLTDTVQEGLEVILQQAQKLTALASNFVLFKTVNEVAELRKPSDLVAIINAAVAGASVEARRKRITLDTDVDADLPPVHVNALAIHQVFDNLLGNALKFTPAGGYVYVRARVADLADYLVVEVEDTGIGIAVEDQVRIFSRFAQVSHPQVAATGGVGLGLAVSKEIIEAHGGTITVSSEPGKGATFQFLVPAAYG